MLGKLLRYDFRSMVKQFSILWPAVLVAALLNRLVTWAARNSDFFLELGFLRGSFGLLEMIPAMAYFALMVALVAATFLYVIQRFYFGLLGDEGYLMHTLPVRPWQLIFSKLIAATAACFISVSVGILSIATLDQGLGFTDLLRALWESFPRLENFGEYMLLLQFLLAAVFVLWGSVTKVYAACALGQLSNKNRVLCSVVGYIVLNIAGTVLLIFLAYVLDWVDAFTGLFDGLSQAASAFLSPWSKDTQMLLTFHGAAGLVNLFLLAKAALYFFLTEYLLRKKLNLQ